MGRRKHFGGTELKRKRGYTLTKLEGKYGGDNMDSYKIISSIGQGAYAEVKEGMHYGTQDHVALKIYDKFALLDSARRNNVLREIKVLESLDHPNIMRILDCVESDKQVVIVLEHITGVSLKGLLAGLADHMISESDARPIFFQLLDAVAYCHSRGVTHRDLKLENVLLTPQKAIKLIDFGFSTWANKDHKLKTFCGTPTYMAPEIINKSEYLGPPTDMWALGVIFYALVCGSFPFHGNNS
ncbi:MAG: protein kinase [Candidatus Pacebacteria bacterium]|nr:protein kinase [Candidatus Paceibacterota bacterium]